MKHIPGNHIVGDGPAKVIAMHNWMATMESYAGIWPFLDGKSFSYAFMDHRGYGKSRSAEGEYSVREAANDVLSLANHLGWDRFHVIGHSMSGMVAQRLTVDARHRIKSFVAVTPVPASGVPLDPEGTTLFESALSEDESWKTISHMMTGQRLSDGWHEWQLRNFRANVRPDAAAGYFRMWVHSNFHEEVVGNPIACLVIAGKHDIPAFRPDAFFSTLGAWYPNARLAPFEASGHHPMAEEPIHFVTEVERFLRLHSS